MHLTDEQKQQIVDAAAIEIRERAVKQAVESLANWTSSAVSSAIDDEVRELVKREIVPAVREELMAKRPILIQAAVAAADDMATAIRKAMVDKLTAKLATDYEARQIFKQMFGL
jgi:hypothetical protein